MFTAHGDRPNPTRTDTGAMRRRRSRYGRFQVDVQMAARCRQANLTRAYLLLVLI